MKSLKLIFFKYSVLLLGVCSNALADADKTTISSGQPGQSIGFGILERGYFQYQSNFDFAKVDHISVDTGSLVLRFGVYRRFEISATLAHQEVERLSGEASSWSIGGRYQILEKDKHFVPLVLQMRVGLLENEYIVKSVMSTGGGLTRGFNWTLNLRHAVFENSENVGGYSLNLGKTLSSKWSTFFENYGVITSSRTQTFFDTGFAYLINKDLQFDASVGYGSSYSEDLFFFNVGLSGRFKLL